MATRVTPATPISPFDADPAGWNDQQINDHPLAELGWEKIPPDQVEEARRIQLEKLRRFHVRGLLPEYAEDVEDLELLIEITADAERFARVCANWRSVVEHPSPILELPPGCSTFQEAGDAWFIGDD